MEIKSVFDFPAFDTGQYEGCRFVMEAGSAELIVRVVGIPSISIKFSRVRWHEFTALHNCRAEQIDGAYFRLVKVVGSPKLLAYLEADSAGARAYSELHHYRVFLDETGCHEVFSESATCA